MRVVVVGASGNTGTALLRALADEPAISSVLGIARRVPDQDEHPYRTAEWATFDVGPAVTGPDEDALVDRLAGLFADADAVVNLSWLIQPNHDRDLLRRTNVDGTERVARAVVRAGVPQLVTACSVGSYSPAHDDEPRDESWRTGGFPTSHYSVDKVAQERVLDRIEADHPHLTVTRVRPALIFQGDAGAEIARYFLGVVTPLAPLRDGRLPALPLPAGLRLQVVHADDVAQAYLQTILQRAGGAFNVASDPVLRGQDLADILDHGRLLEVPAPALRPLVSLAWQARALPTDPGWLDMAMGVPLMDTSRARTELGWSARHSAHDALAELVEGMARGRGKGTTPMRPHGEAEQPAPTRGRHARPTSAAAGGAMTPHVPDTYDDSLLGLYLSDHLTGATAGLSRFERIAEAYRDLPLHAELVEVTEQIRAEREFLDELIENLQLSQRPHRQAAAWLGEHFARLKANGRFFSRSPMSAVLEPELMRSAVLGKLGVWQTLRDLAPDLGLDAEEMQSLADQARAQAEVLGRVHAYARV
ncbi:NAD-dependent epimerase/dehydratase family protein, partial [Georgenia sp. 10Sc9-8]|nr:NAD-dependent epimerase/dehydratase family protein [Georgenia halotolerans]